MAQMTGHLDCEEIFTIVKQLPRSQKNTNLAMA